MEKTSYAIGMNIGANLLQSGAKNINIEALSRGLADTLKGNKTEIQPREAGIILNRYFSQLEENKNSQTKNEGQAYLDANAQRDEVTTLPSGLQYEILKQGDGPKPLPTDTVKCHYEGKLINGNIFDSSYKRGTPANFPVKGVIAGWVEALQLMNVGSKWKLHIPYNLAYGARGAGEGIPPYATLIFEVELLDILK